VIRLNEVADDKKIGEILIEGGKASEEDVQRALDLQAQVGGRVGRLLVAMGIVAEEVLVEALSKQLRIPKVSLRGRTAGPGLTALLPAELARRRMLLPVALSRVGDKEVLYVATADPTDRAGIEEAARVSAREVIPLLAPFDELSAALDRSYPPAAAPSDLASTTLGGAGRDVLLTALARLLLRKGILSQAELEDELRKK
jgi:hypothetical protein